MYKKFKKYLFFHQYICQLLKNMRTRRSNLTASVLSISISISTSICTLVVPSLLSGTLVNCILKLNRSDKVCVQYNFKCDAMSYLRIGLFKPSSFLIRPSILFLSISTVPGLHLQARQLPQLVQAEIFPLALKWPR